MESFYKAQEDIKNINAEVERVRSAMNTKLAILNSINSYTASMEQAILQGSDRSSGYRIIFNHDKDRIAGGRYDSYGQTVHAKYVRLPVNIFNVLTESGPLFKSNVSVSIYESDDGSESWAKPAASYKAEYADMLKHESDKTKEDVFLHFTKDKITLEIQLGTGSLVGMSSFDTLEICPYMPGSFDIDEMRLYTMQQYLEQDMISPKYYTGRETDGGTSLAFAKDVGNCRIALGEAQQLYSMEIDLHLKYDDGTGFPFGLRHLYFLNTAADSSSDHIIVEVETDDYIESIGKGIRLYTADGYVDDSYTSESYGIEYYMFYSNDALSNLIDPNTNIARNIKSFFAKVPLKQPLIGIEFTEVELR